MDKSKKRLKVVPTDDDDDTCLTFVLKGEDHTLGNALREIISKNPEVQLCGYAVPHPSVHEINLRIQTYGVPASEVFKKGLEDLHSLCEHISNTFQAAVKEYNNAQDEEIERRFEEMEAQ